MVLRMLLLYALICDRFKDKSFAKFVPVKIHNRQSDEHAVEVYARLLIH